MRNITTAIIASVAVLCAGPAAAAAASKEENIGVGSGALIGVAAGGPVGLIIGAAIGAKVGDTLYRKKEEITQLESSVDSSNTTIMRLEHDIDTLGGEVERLQGLARPELVSLMQAGIAMDLLFRTDESVLADTTGVRLNELASTLATMGDIHIRLDGFADERGDADYNQALSEKRVRFVRDQFVAAGVNPNRISIAAHGESAAQDETLDSYALERRVSVKLFIDESPSVASNAQSL